VLFVLAAYRLIAPGSQWRLHREWYGRTALADLLGADEALADPHVLYGCCRPQDSLSFISILMSPDGITS
jgi:hypothetical protein